MDRPFDPYYVWLGIPPAEQPPDHYRLLGIPRFERDPVVIENAADRQTMHLRSLAAGPQADASQRLLNEVAAARVCLLDPAKKDEYDARLRGGGVAPAGSALGEGQVFDQYILLDKLDAGRSGQVLKARHQTMGRIVALKILSQAAMASAQFRERFQRKIKILAQLQHPNLVAAYEAGEHQGTYYLAMEYIDGQDLRSLVQQYGPPPADRVVEYIRQAAEGLAFAHRQGVVHRDIKPANLLLDRQGTIKIIGLGLAHVEADSVLVEEGQGELTRQGQIMGTYDYMSPEQAVDSSRVDPRSDVYSLGCALYSLATGKPPYPAKSPMQQVTAHRSNPIPSLRAARPEFPEWLDLVFQKMLAKAPEERYQTMDEVAAALRTATATAPAAVPPAVPPGAPQAIPAAIPGAMPPAGAQPLPGVMPQAMPGMMPQPGAPFAPQPLMPGAPQYAPQPGMPQYGVQPGVPQYGVQPGMPQYGAQPVAPQYGVQPVMPQYGVQPGMLGMAPQGMPPADQGFAAPGAQGLDFLGQPRPASAAAVRAPTSKAKPKKGLRHPVTQFYLIGSLVLVIIIIVLLVISRRQDAAREAANEAAAAEETADAEATPAAEPAEAPKPVKATKKTSTKPKAKPKAAEEEPAFKGGFIMESDKSAGAAEPEFPPESPLTPLSLDDFATTPGAKLPAGKPLPADDWVNQAKPAKK